MLPYLVAGAAILAIGLIFRFSNVKRNYWLGYRTRQAMKSPEHWAFANRRMGRHAILIGTVSLVAGTLLWLYGVDSVYLMVLTLLLLLIAIVDVEVALRRIDKL